MTVEEKFRICLRQRLANELEHRAVMATYLETRLKMNDMHGVQDAGSDIREIDARIALLKELRRVLR